jgi:hypothetical protein
LIAAARAGVKALPGTTVGMRIIAQAFHSPVPRRGRTLHGGGTDVRSRALGGDGSAAAKFNTPVPSCAGQVA